MRLIIERSAYLYYSAFRSRKFFTFRGKKYHYFYHMYNRTVASERVVEIPIACRLLGRYKGKKVLEVGNVLSHYFSVTHDVLDKYEKGSGVINADVAEFKLSDKYDLIFSVSTMEHVGWSYGEKKDSRRFLRGIRNLKRHLSKNGVLMVTFPLYYRDDLSQLILTGKMPFNREYFMRRTSFWNEWVQVDLSEASLGDAYDKYYANANVLYIGFYSD